MGSTPDRSRLIVNADDLGLAESVNRGIIEAHEAGAVTSASVIVNLPAFDDAVARSRAALALGTGLHLNLVLGRPLTRAPSLTDARTGDFRSLADLARRAFAGRVSSAEVQTECAAQIARMRNAGLRLTHVDGHRHAHTLPGVWAAVVRAAREAGVAVVRVPLEPFAFNPADAAATVKKVALALSWYLASRGLAAMNRPDRFVGLSLQGGRQFERRLLRFLDRPPPGTTELMVHPGYDSPELSRLDPYRGARETELAALTSPSVRDALSRIERVHFDQL